ncbi:MAG: cyclic nucleotide-binding domain-containing protein [Blastochloris sp.]|nr:cyclic nucleotide-binding domain-containing protein [Blastochloris sp.]
MNNLDTMDQCLRKTPLFSWLSTESIAWLAHYTEELSFNQGDTILELGSLSDSLYIIAQGEVTFICGTSQDTDEQQATSLDEMDIFGELSLLEIKPRTSLVRAALPTTLYRLKAETIAQLAQKNQDQHAILITNLSRFLARKIRTLNSKKSILNQATSKE